MSIEACILFIPIPLIPPMHGHAHIHRPVRIHVCSQRLTRRGAPLAVLQITRSGVGGAHRRRRDRVGERAHLHRSSPRLRKAMGGGSRKNEVCISPRIRERWPTFLSLLLQRTHSPFSCTSKADVPHPAVLHMSAKSAWFSAHICRKP